MPLIKDIATAKKYVNVLFNNSESSLADITSAEMEFLLPILGEELYQQLLVEADVTDSDYADLIELARRAVGPLAYWMDLGSIQTKITDNGLGTFNNTNMDASHRWEFEQLKETLANKGCAALDQMLQHLFENAEYYSWTAPDDLNIIFTSGKDFAKYFPLYQPHRVFMNLRPLIKQVEDQYIRPAIGDAFFEELRDALLPQQTSDETNEDEGDDATALTAEEKIATDIIKKAVANLTIKTAIETLPVRISPAGFTVEMQRNNEMVQQGQNNAPANQMSLMYQSVERTGESYVLQLQDYLNKKASGSVFATYFASSYYVAPADAVLVADPNSLRVVYGM